MRRRGALGICVVIAGLVSYALAAGETAPAAKKAAAARPAHVVMNSGDMKFGDQPPSLPAGAKVAVLSGDPGKAGMFVIRVKAPDGYKVPPHWHATAENITVISGTFHIVSGDVLDEAKGTALSPGGFMSMPAKMHHAAWVTGATEFEIASIGPFSITYVNKADDPRLAKK